MSEKKKLLIVISSSVKERLKVRQHSGQTWNGVIEELLDNATCPLCGKPSGGVHEKCVNIENNK